MSAHHESRDNRSSIRNLYVNSPYQRVIIIDDQSIGRNILQRLIMKISPDVKAYAYANPLDALDACKQYPPDLLITDYRMPNMIDGIEVIERFRQIAGCEDVPIVMVTIIEDRDIKYKALEAGATDFLSRPFDHYECQARCKNLLDLYRHKKEQAERSTMLERQIKEATSEIRAREEDALFCLAKAGEFRDECTGSHILRLARYSTEIAKGLGMSQDQCELIELAAPMHDIGKIGVPDHILLKKGKLTPDERRIMETHAQIGYEILNGSKSRYLKMGAIIALAHHERFDGTGYPNALAGKSIPLEAHIVAIADVLDALSTKRPYKEPWTISDSLEYIKVNSGTQFNPECVNALFSREEFIRKIYSALPGCIDQ